MSGKEEVERPDSELGGGAEQPGAFAFTYVVTAQKPTIVSHSATG